MSQRVLVIGGTGPTGIPLLRGLVARGHAVTILPRGLHESADTPTDVHHLHTDPYDETDLRAAIQGQTFDTVFAMYGRLRMIAEVFRGRTDRFISVGGVPVYRGREPRLPTPRAGSRPIRPNPAGSRNRS